MFFGETLMTGRTKTRKTWNEKLADCKGLPKDAKIEGKLSKRWGSGTFVIPAPLEVDAAMKQIRRGKVTTINAICQSLASKHNTTIACPITTGIFAWMAAHAANEAEEGAANGSRPIGERSRTTVS
jgi:hypothetical protein